MTKVCETNSLDISLLNDWEEGTTRKYCGKKFLGECFGKGFGRNFKVTLLMSNWALHTVNLRDELCLEWIKHFKKGPDPRKNLIEDSMSRGWSDDTDGETTIESKFLK